MQGTRLGPYEILEQLGAGGMGEVWAAQDTRLGRKVAIKVLPAEYAADRERLSRFEQEARAAAALNHPHIATVYDIGHEGGTHFMVQELLEGRSLRATLEAGPLPRARALQIGAEIAEALGAAHRAGIVHRDLKPENVFVSPDGHAKVLDFGLAKLTEPGGAGINSQSMSPTVLGTVTGTIMGTAGYMAPEQVAGGEVDRRADLFALGCVLYEMLTGDRAFRGETVIDTLHAITRTQPRRLQDAGDAAIDRDAQWLLQKCLEKEPASRYQHADDLAVDLRRQLSRPVAAATDVAATVAPIPAASRAGSRLAWIVAAVATLAAALAGYRALMPTAVREVVRLSIPVTFRAATSQFHSISPDGQLIVYEDPDKSALMLRRLDSFEVMPVRGGEGGIGPFFSPDGRRLAFFARGKLWSVDVAGGDPREICDVSQTNSAGVWMGDDIYFVQWALGRGVFRVPAEGGVAEEVIPPDEFSAYTHGPRALPDGTGVVVRVDDALSRGISRSRVHFFDGRASITIDRGQATYLADGTALYVAGGTLLAASYDPATWQVTGEPTPLAEGVVDYQLSASGTLAYRWGNADRTDSYARVTRAGQISTIAEYPGGFGSRPQISPDGRQFITNSVDTSGIFVWDAARGTRRLIRDGGLYPVWLPDGDGVILLDRAGAVTLLRRVSLTDRSVDEVLLSTPELPAWPTGVSPDGRHLLYYQINPDTERDIWVLPLDGGEPFPFLVTPASERSAVFSPDGRWVAYMSDITGREEVYVRPAPGRAGAEVIITPEGGREPRWSPRGDEIYFRKDDGLWAVRVTAEPRFTAGEAELLFRGNFRREEGGRNQEYDVFPDGDLLMSFVSDVDDELRIVVNWSEELDRLRR